VGLQGGGSPLESALVPRKQAQEEAIMPLFKRKDGTLVKTTSRVRRMIPYIMKGRNESIVYHEQVIDLS
jgi:hypothetical protein